MYLCNEEMQSIDSKTGYIYAMIEMPSIDRKSVYYLWNEEMHSIDSKTGYFYAIKNCTQ